MLIVSHSGHSCKWEYSTKFTYVEWGRIMYDIESKTIILQIDTEVYLFRRMLDLLPVLTSIVRTDPVVRELYRRMSQRVDALYPDVASGCDIDNMFVCAFGEPPPLS